MATTAVPSFAGWRSHVKGPTQPESNLLPHNAQISSTAFSELCSLHDFLSTQRELLTQWSSSISQPTTPSSAPDPLLRTARFKFSERVEFSNEEFRQILLQDLLDNHCVDDGNSAGWNELRCRIYAILGSFATTKATAADYLKLALTTCPDSSPTLKLALLVHSQLLEAEPSPSLDPTLVASTDYGPQLAASYYAQVALRRCDPSILVLADDALRLLPDSMSKPRQRFTSLLRFELNGLKIISEPNQGDVKPFEHIINALLMDHDPCHPLVAYLHAQLIMLSNSYYDLSVEDACNRLSRARKLSKKSKMVGYTIVEFDCWEALWTGNAELRLSAITKLTKLSTPLAVLCKIYHDWLWAVASSMPFREVCDSIARSILSISGAKWDNLCEAGDLIAVHRYMSKLSHPLEEWVVSVPEAERGDRIEKVKTIADAFASVPSMQNLVFANYVDIAW